MRSGGPVTLSATDRNTRGNAQSTHDHTRAMTHGDTHGKQ